MNYEHIIFKAKLQSQKLIMNCIRGLNGFHPATTIFPKNCSYRLVYPQQEILKPQICCHQFDSLFNQADLPISGHISLPKKHLEAHSTLYQNRTRLTGIMESSVYKDQFSLSTKKSIRIFAKTKYFKQSKKYRNCKTKDEL